MVPGQVLRLGVRLCPLICAVSGKLARLGLRQCQPQHADIAELPKPRNLPQPHYRLPRWLIQSLQVESCATLVQRILSNRHIVLSDFSYAVLSSVAVATATPPSSALHMKKSSYVNIAES